MSLFSKIIIWIIPFVFCVNVYAQNTVDDLYLDSMLYLNEVIVVSNKYKEIIPSQKLSGEELQRLNSHSVADAVRYFSGIQIKDYGGIGGLKTVDLRSMGTNHMGVFYDGIQLGNAQNGQVDLGKFSLDNVEEISLYNGQKSEIFQSAKDFGSSGSLYIRTRRPRFEGNKKTNIQGIVRGGSFDLINPSVLWEQKLSSTVSSSLNVEYLNSSGKYKFRYKRVNPDGSVAWDTTAVRQNGDIQSYRIEAGINGFVERGKWNLKTYYYDSERGIPGAIVNNVWKHSQRQWDRNFFTQASFQKELSSRYELMVNAKYSNDYMRYLNPDTTLKYIDNDFRQQEVYLSLANKFTITSNWDVALSVDHQWNLLEARRDDFIRPHRNTTLIALATAFEWNRIKVLGSVLGTFVQDKISGSQRSPSSSSKDEYTPAIFISYRPFDKADFLVRSFYKRIFRMPTFNDLYYTDIGNPELRPEYTTQYNLGFQYKKDFNRIFRNFDLQLDMYYNEVTDKIITEPQGSNLFRWKTMNVGKVEIRGIDISSKISVYLPSSIILNANLSYTYQKAQDYSDYKGPNEWIRGGQIAYIPWHSGSAIISGIYKTWDLNYSFVYIGERYHNSANIQENYEQPWYTSDMSLGKELNYKSLRFKLTAEVNNLLDQQYDVVQNYPMPGRNYKLILKIII